MQLRRSCEKCFQITLSLSALNIKVHVVVKWTHYNCSLGTDTYYISIFTWPLGRTISGSTHVRLLVLLEWGCGTHTWFRSPCFTINEHKCSGRGLGKASWCYPRDMIGFKQLLRRKYLKRNIKVKVRYLVKYIYIMIAKVISDLRWNRAVCHSFLMTPAKYWWVC